MQPVPKEEPKIIELFYRTQLRENENVIDNMDSTIAKEVGVNIGVVHRVLAREMKRKVRILDLKDFTEETEDVKKTEDVEDIEVIYETIEPNLYFNP